MQRSSEPDFVVADVVVRRGRRATIEVPFARVPSGSPASLSICIVRGRRPGPTVWVSAAVHGDEINGVEIIRRVLGELDARSMRGTLLAVPVVNVFGFVEQRRYLPDRRDLNRCFPGSPRGSLGARLAHLFMTEVVDRCEWGIDLHTGSDRRSNLPQIRANLDDEATLELARAFGAPVLLHSAIRDGSLREAARQRGARVLLYEGGEALRFDRGPIQAGSRGVLSVLRRLDMIDLDVEEGGVEPFVARSSRWLRSPSAGIFHPEVELGERVERGADVGRVADVFGRKDASVRSSVEGIVIGQATNPLVYQGDALVNVAYA